MVSHQCQHQLTKLERFHVFENQPSPECQLTHIMITSYWNYQPIFMTSFERSIAVMVARNTEVAFCPQRRAERSSVAFGNNGHAGGLKQWQGGHWKSLDSSGGIPSSDFLLSDWSTKRYPACVSLGGSYISYRYTTGNQWLVNQLLTHGWWLMVG